MQRHKVTRIKRKSKGNAAEMEQGHDFSRSKTRKNSLAKDQILKDKCTRGEIEAGAELEADVTTFWLERSGVSYIFENLEAGLELERSLSTFTVQICIFSPFSVKLFRFEVCWSEVLPKSLGVGLKPELLGKKLERSSSRKFATPLHF